MFNSFSTNVFLGEIIFFFISFFTATAFMFLFNLRFVHAYSYTYATALIDICFVIFSIWIFTNMWFLGGILFLFIRVLRQS
jgi:hypothetical protein